MRFAAALFIKLLEKSSPFRVSALLLVAVIGVKLTADWVLNGEEITRLEALSPGHSGTP